MRLLQHTVLLGLAVLVAAEKVSDGKLLEIPLMPRIPSQAKHMEVLKARAVQFKPDTTATVSTTCHNPAEFVAYNHAISQSNYVLTHYHHSDIDAHDESEAQLSICGGIPGSIQDCQGAPAKTEGRARTALFTLSAVGTDNTIDISKQQWLRCVHAARAACPSGSLSAVCNGGASNGGNVAFTLTKP